MGILQLYLRYGENKISLEQSIPKGSVKVKHVASTFNVENHGYVLANLSFQFAYSNNFQNSTKNSNKTLIIPLDHNKSYSTIESDWNISEVEIPRNFTVRVDLDRGIYAVDETQTRLGQPYYFAPAGKEDRFIYDYVQNPPAGAYTSMGVFADKILDGTVAHTNGQLDGPRAFLYQMIVTLEYDDGLTEQRLQSLIS